MESWGTATVDMHLSNLKMYVDNKASGRAWGVGKGKGGRKGGGERRGK
jgi:hypothetical protein